MKILIVYSSRNGVAKKCAELLANELADEHMSTLVDCRKEDIPAPAGFDAVVIGSSVRMENIDRRVRKYVRENLEALNSMPCAIYICCGFTRLFSEYAEALFPKRFQPSLGAHLFGGELKPERVRGFDKLVVASMRNSIQTQDFEEDDRDHHDLPEIIPENISLLAAAINELGC